MQNKDTETEERRAEEKSSQVRTPRAAFSPYLFLKLLLLFNMVNRSALARMRDRKLNLAGLAGGSEELRKKPSVTRQWSSEGVAPCLLGLGHSVS